MKLTDLTDKFSLKYAADEPEGDKPSEFRGTVQTDFNYPEPPAVGAAPNNKANEMVGLIIQHCEENGLYGSTESDYLHSLLDRGESPKHILTLIKGRIDNAQAKLNNCKQMLRDWGKLIK